MSDENSPSGAGFSTRATLSRDCAGFEIDDTALPPDTPVIAVGGAPLVVLRPPLPLTMLEVWGVITSMYSDGIGIQLVERWNVPLFRSCSINWKFGFSTPPTFSATFMATL